MNSSLRLVVMLVNACCWSWLACTPLPMTSGCVLALPSQVPVGALGASAGRGRAEGEAQVRAGGVATHVACICCWPRAAGMVACCPASTPSVPLGYGATSVHLLQGGGPSNCCPITVLVTAATQPPADSLCVGPPPPSLSLPCPATCSRPSRRRACRRRTAAQPQQRALLLRS